ncbi:hypothetical protein JL722_9523 [Aureococcus anophagefferens]|nr:hypothetical protein JL722_9523 [Aureococcus anophagefferens]
MLRGLVVVAAVVAQVRDAPSGYRAGKPSGANAFALYDACNSSLRALVAAGAKARSLDAIVACETVACACDGSGAPPDCPMAQPWVAADWNDLLEPTARDEAKIHGEEPAGRAPDAALYRLATQLLKRQLVVAMECGAALGLSSHLDFENATRGVNRYIGTIMRVEALANLLPHLFEAQRYRFACCLASEERLGGCGETLAPSGEDPAAAAALRAGKLDRTLRAALEGAPALDGGGSVDVSPKATSRYAVAHRGPPGPLKRLTFAYRSEQDKAKGRRYANHVIDRVFRRDWTLFPDAAGFQVWVLVDASELPNAGNLFVAETPELLESDPPLRWDFDERGGATKNTYLGTQFPMPLKTYGSWERGAKLSFRYFNGTEGDALVFSKRTLHMSDPRPHLLRDLRERPPDRLAVSVRAAVKDADGGLNFWPGHTSTARLATDPAWVDHWMGGGAKKNGLHRVFIPNRHDWMHGIPRAAGPWEPLDPWRNHPSRRAPPTPPKLRPRASKTAHEKFVDKFDGVAQLMTTPEQRASWERVKLNPPEITGDDQLYVDMEALAATVQAPPWRGGNGRPP